MVLEIEKKTDWTRKSIVAERSRGEAVGLDVGWYCAAEGKYRDRGTGCCTAVAR